MSEKRAILFDNVLVMCTEKWQEKEKKQYLGPLSVHCFVAEVRAGAQEETRAAVGLRILQSTLF